MELTTELPRPSQLYCAKSDLLHLVFDAKDEYEVRQPNCGALIKECAGGGNAGSTCLSDTDCPGSNYEMLAIARIRPQGNRLG